jgi:hypothetical protein
VRLAEKPVALWRFMPNGTQLGGHRNAITKNGGMMAVRF